MMHAARDNAPEAVKLLAVTVLTSLDAEMLASIGQDSDHPGQVLRLAGLADRSGMDGVVCSAGELDAIRKNLGDDVICMVPGIRPARADTDDQKRVSTPAAAIQAGATHLVIGRPITQADDREAALSAISREIEETANAAKG
jgi:orotidine-5'-phosphate decarboxylase